MSEREFKSVEAKMHAALETGTMDPETAMIALKLFAPDVAAKFEAALKTKNVEPLLKKKKGDKP